MSAEEQRAVSAAEAPVRKAKSPLASFGTPMQCRRFSCLHVRERDVDSLQPTPTARRRYDEETRATLQRAFRDGWKLLKERQPAHSWETHNDLKHALSERLMLLADEGVTDPDGLLHRALEGLVAGDGKVRPSKIKDGLARAKRLKSPVRKPPKTPSRHGSSATCPSDTRRLAPSALQPTKRPLLPRCAEAKRLRPQAAARNP